MLRKFKKATLKPTEGVSLFAAWTCGTRRLHTRHHALLFFLARLRRRTFPFAWGVSESPLTPSAGTSPAESLVWPVWLDGEDAVTWRTISRSPLCSDPTSSSSSTLMFGTTVTVHLPPATWNLRSKAATRAPNERCCTRMRRVVFWSGQSA